MNENPTNERIIESPENNGPVDAVVEITTDPEGTIANMVLHAPRFGGRPVTEAMVVQALKEHNIVHGIDEFNIKDLLKNVTYEFTVCIARCTAPKRGSNGYINYHYDKARELKPTKNEFGIANYRELNAVIPIRKGDVIADIILPTPGTPGCNVFGKPIPAEAGTAAKVNVGKNTLLTSDGTAVVAACDGHIVFTGGVFVVEDTVTIKTDLDLSVGNITYFGDVHIKGNVMEGFTINAGKNVKIDGSVFGSEIIVGGDLTIVGGCINSKVTCEGSADIGFCENAEMFIKGSLTSKQLAFCNVLCYGEVTTKGARGVITGGKITSMKGVTAAIIGSETYTLTEINIGDGSVLFARKREAEAELMESERIFDCAVKNLSFLKHRREAQGGKLTESQQHAFRVETQNKLYHAMRKAELQKTIEELENDIRLKDSLTAKCTGRIYPGSRFCINFLTLEVSQLSQRAMVTVVEDRLEVVPI